MNTAKNSNGSAELLPCPFCSGAADWCDCGECHQIQCKACGLQADNNHDDTLIPEELNDLRDWMAAWWNRRAATVTQIDCAAVEELVEADLEYDEALRLANIGYGSTDADRAAQNRLREAIRSRRTALAAFRSTT